MDFRYPDTSAARQSTMAPTLCPPEPITPEGSGGRCGRIWKGLNRAKETHGSRSETRTYFYWNRDGNRNCWLHGRGGECLSMRKFWSWREESNLQPAVYKTAALPIELRQHGNDINELQFYRLSVLGSSVPVVFSLRLRSVKNEAR